MEGAYNRVLSARQTVPHETYVYFMDLAEKLINEVLAEVPYFIFRLFSS